MNSKILRVAMVLTLVGATLLQGQPAPKLNNLIVYGKGFAFGVKEPDGWQGDTDKVASRYQVNVVFLPPSESQHNDVTIRVRVNEKEDENTIEDLNYDMNQYKRDFPMAQFADLNITHSEYKTFARTVFVPGKFYEYVAYLNPGPGKKFIFSVAMSKKNEPATEAEMMAYKSVLGSVVWLTSSVVEKR
jgi:hypothetical protein